MRASVRFEHQLLAVETEHRVHAMLELVAPGATAGSHRQPLHIALVIDRSGSMGGYPLEVVRQCATQLVKRLAPTDELAIITYDNEIDLVAPLAPVTDRSGLLNAIAGIYARGSTNLSGGWLKGNEVLRSARGEGPKKILLLTDGLANQGITELASLVRLSDTARATGIGTSTIGFGPHFDEDLLSGMADSGGGNAYYAETPDEAPRIFGDEFEGLMNLVAQNISVEIRPSKEVEVLGVLNDYPATPVTGGLQLQLGDAYADELRRVVFEMHVPELAKLGAAKVAEVLLRYVSLGDEIASHEIKLPLAVNLVSADDAAISGPDKEVVEEVVILKAARAQQEARKRADSGDEGAAYSLLQDSAGELLAFAYESDRGDELRAQSKLHQEAAERLRAEGWNPALGKQWNYQSRATSRGRRKK